MSKQIRENKKIADILNQIKDVSMSPSSLEALMNFERVIDDLDLYAFQHWIHGELVEGPEISKYRVKCTFMWPLTKMPDPSGASRLLPYGIIVSYKKDWLVYPIEIHDPSDYRPRLKKPKLSRTRVWLVSIDMPKHLIKEVTVSSEEIVGREFDLDDLNDAYEDGLDEPEATLDDNEQEEQLPQQE